MKKIIELRVDVTVENTNTGYVQVVTNPHFIVEAGDEWRINIEGIKPGDELKYVDVKVLRAFDGL